MQCLDCHRKVPEEAMIYGDQVKIFFIINLTETEHKENKLIERYLAEEFDLIDFVLTSENEAEVRIKCDIKIEEKFDDRMIDKESGVRMFKGTCRMRMLHNNSEIYHGIIESKVISGRDADKTQETVLNFLAERIFMVSKTPLEKILEE